MTRKCRFCSSWIPFALGLGVLAVMVVAGFWQLDRGGQKTQLDRAYARALQQPPVGRSGILDFSATEHYKRIRLTGHFMHQWQFLLDNQIYHDDFLQGVGYAVLTPFETSEKDIILVNRGWVAAAADRSQLPKIEVSASPTVIEGLMSHPSSGYRMGEMDADLRWPRVIQYIDIKKISARMQHRLHSAIVRLDKHHVAAYRDNWKPTGMGAQRHFGYAVQWFGMALVLAVLLVINLVRKIRVGKSA